MNTLKTGTGSRLASGIVIVGALSGCGQDMSDLHQFVREVKARPATAIEPIPVIKPYVRFVYPGHGIDPFDTSVLKADSDKQVEGSVLIDKNRNPEFLEKFPLDSLRMVGTVFKEDELWALIRIPGGAVHRVKAGNYMGQNHGKILGIKNTRIALKEIVDNGFGGFKERENELSISNPNK